MTDTHTKNIADVAADALSDGLIETKQKKIFPSNVAKKMVITPTTHARAGTPPIPRRNDSSGVAKKMVIPSFLNRRTKMEMFTEDLRDLVEESARQSVGDEYFLDSKKFNHLVGTMWRFIADIFDEAGIVWHPDGFKLIKRTCEHIIRHQSSILREDNTLATVTMIDTTTGELEAGLSSDDLNELSLEDLDALRCLRDLKREGLFASKDEDNDIVSAAKAQLRDLDD